MLNKSQIKKGDIIRVGGIHANSYNYTRIVGKEVTVKSISERSNYTAVHVVYLSNSDKESRWFILLEDAHSTVQMNTNYKHLLMKEEF